MTSLKREALLRLAIVAAGLAAIAMSGVAYGDSYTYDALGRLHSVTYADGSTITYDYDDAGNRTTVTQTAAP